MADYEFEGRPHTAVTIIEQPARNAVRFRYECEARVAGSIPGKNSTSTNTTYPTIKISGYTGPARMLVSCVTAKSPYRPHPHNLVGDKCLKGVCTFLHHVTDDTRYVHFEKLGIQSTKVGAFKKALDEREQLMIDPFKTGFEHKNSSKKEIGLNMVRLCFEVHSENVDQEGRRRRQLLGLALSDVIVDKKVAADLSIVRSSHCAGAASGGTTLVLLCEKVNPHLIAVEFFHEEGHQVVWQQRAKIVQVHKQVAIVIQTPPYWDPKTSVNIEVFFQLVNLENNDRSNTIPFEYIADFSDLQAKRRKMVHSLINNYRHEGTDARCQQQSFAQTAEQDRSVGPGPCTSRARPETQAMLPPDQQAYTSYEHVSSIQTISSEFRAMSVDEQVPMPPSAEPTNELQIPDDVVQELIKLGIDFSSSSLLQLPPPQK